MSKAPSTAFRAHNPNWAHSPVSGEGAKLHGGRFNRIGEPALYLSLDRLTALREASQGFQRKSQPLTVVQYEIDCQDVVDLTDKAERKAWGVTEADLGCGWMLLSAKGLPVPTWLIADRLRAAGKAGILLKSFAPGAQKSDVCLVLWTWSSKLPYRVVAIDDEARLRRR